MKPRVAVLCAYNEGNAGMYSVDLAATEFFAAHGVEPDLFVAQTGKIRGGRFLRFLGESKVTRKRIRFGKLSHSLVRDVDALRDYSHLFYWGDFLNNPVYGHADFSDRDMWLGHSVTRTEAFTVWERLFALTNGKVTDRVVSVGNNFQHDFRAMPVDVEPIFAKIGLHFDALLPRDPFSLENLVRHLRTDAICSVSQGMDCAFLLGRTAKPTSRQEFCFHFGRSGFRQSDRLIQRLEEVTGCRGVPLTHWLKLKRKGAHDRFSGMRLAISRSLFVVSDTYHVCVNAMNAGTPVYGLGRATAEQKGTLGDFKKVQLFEMLKADPFYLQCSADEGEGAFFDRVAQVVQTGLHLDRDVTSIVEETLETRVAAFRRSLKDLLFS